MNRKNYHTEIQRIEREFGENISFKNGVPCEYDLEEACDKPNLAVSGVEEVCHQISEMCRNTYCSNLPVNSCERFLYEWIDECVFFEVLKKLERLYLRQKKTFPWSKIAAYFDSRMVPYYKNKFMKCLESVDPIFIGVSEEIRMNNLEIYSKEDKSTIFIKNAETLLNLTSSFLVNQVDRIIIKLGRDNQRSLEHLIESFQEARVREINLSFNDLGQEGVAKFFCCSELKQLETLDLSCVNLNRKFDFSDLKIELTHLKRLLVNNNLMNEDAFISFLEFLGREGCFEELVELNLCANEMIGEKIVDKFLKIYLPAIKSLCLAATGISAKDVARIVKSENFPKLEHINLEFICLNINDLNFFLSKEFDQIKDIDLSFNDFNFEEFVLFALNHRFLPNLEGISFRSGAIFFENLDQLFRSGKFGKLKKLVLGSVFVTGNFDPFKDLPVDLGLEELNFRKGNNLSSQLLERIFLSSSFSNLKRLSLEECEISSEDIESILSFSGSLKLEFLSLKGNNLSYEVAEKIIYSSVFKNLRFLNLKLNNFSSSERLKLKSVASQKGLFIEI